MKNLAIGVAINGKDNLSRHLNGLKGRMNSLSSVGGRLAGVMRGSLGGALNLLGVSSLGAVGSIGAIGAAIGTLTKKTIEYGDTVNDISGYLGISKKALQEYRYVAQLSGMTAEEMDGALTKLTVNLGKESGETEKALNTLGLTFDQLRGASPDERLMLIADAMQGVQSDTAKAAIVTSLFGKANAKMVNTLSGGAEGMRALREEANALGYVMDDAAIQAAADADDALQRFNATVGGLGRKIGGTMIPALTKGAATLQGFLTKNADKIGEFMGGLSEIIGQGFDMLFPIMEAAGSLLSPIFDAFKRIGTALAPLKDLFFETFGTVVPILGDMVKSFADALLPVLEDIIPILKGAVTPIFKAFTSILTVLQPVVRSVAAVIGNVLSTVFKVLGPIIERVATIVGGILTRVFTVVGPIIERVAGIVGGVLSRVFEVAGPIIDKVAGIVGGILTTAFDVLTPILESVLGFLEPILNTVMSIVEPVLSLAGVLLDNLAPALKSVEPILKVVGDALKAIMSVLGPVLEGLGKVVGGVAGEIGGIFSGQNVFSAEYQITKQFDGNADMARRALTKAGVGFEGKDDAWIIEAAKAAVRAQASSQDPLAAVRALSLGQPMSANPAAAQDKKDKTEVVVDFRNLPKGTRVESSGAQSGLNMSMGYANVGF